MQYPGRVTRNGVSDLKFRQTQNQRIGEHSLQKQKVTATQSDPKGNDVSLVKLGLIIALVGSAGLTAALLQGQQASQKSPQPTPHSGDQSDMGVHLASTNQSNPLPTVVPGFVCDLKNVTVQNPDNTTFQEVSWENCTTRGQGTPWQNPHFNITSDAMPRSNPGIAGALIAGGVTLGLVLQNGRVLPKADKVAGRRRKAPARKPIHKVTTPYIKNVQKKKHLG